MQGESSTVIASIFRKTLRWTAMDGFWISAIIAVLLFAAAFSFSMGYLGRLRDQGKQPMFYQRFFEPAVRMTCGQPFGFDSTGKVSQELIDFLHVKSDSVLCADVPPAVKADPALILRPWFHFQATVSLIWKVTGISWIVLDRLAATLIAFSVVAVFFLYRLWIPPLIAMAPAWLTIYAVKPVILRTRDLAKTPFILAAMVAVALIFSRRLGRWSFLLLMAMTGGMLGFGYGFRPDVLIAIPLLLGAALILRTGRVFPFVTEGMAGSALLLGAFYLVGMPCFTGGDPAVGSCYWHFAMLGLTDSRVSALGLGQTSYSLVQAYSDGLVKCMTEVYAGYGNVTEPLELCSAMYDQQSGGLLLHLAGAFPADILERVFVAARYVLAFGMSCVSPLKPFAEQLVYPVLLSWLGLLYLLLVRNFRKGLFAIFAVGVLCTYPVIQFDVRHYYHLAFLAWIPVIVLIGVCWRRLAGLPGPGGEAFDPEVEPHWFRAAAVFGGFFLLLAGLHLGACAYQRQSVGTLIQQYLDADGMKIPQQWKSIEDGKSRMSLAYPMTGTPYALNGGQMLRLDFKGVPDGVRTVELHMQVRSLETRYGLNFRTTVDIDKTGAVAFIPMYSMRALPSRVSISIPDEDVRYVETMRWLEVAKLPKVWVTLTAHPQ